MAAHDILLYGFKGGTSSGIGNVVEDTTPQLGGDLDANSYDIQFDDATGIRDDSDNEQLIFQKTASAVNYVEITNAATGNDPTFTANGSDANVGLTIDGKGTGTIAIGSADSVITMDGTSLSGTAIADVERKSISITVEDPTASEDISIGFVNSAMTISEMRAVLVGSSTPSVTWTVRHGTDRSAAGAEVVTSGTTTTSTTTGSDVTTLNDATVVADSFVWLETTAQSGTVDELHLTIVFTYD